MTCLVRRAAHARWVKLLPQFRQIICLVKRAMHACGVKQCVSLTERFVRLGTKRSFDISLHLRCSWIALYARVSR